MTLKNIGITHANHFAKSKAVLTKMHVQPERLYFLFLVLRWALSMVIIVIEKHKKNNYYIQVKSHFSAVEFSNTVIFEEMFVLTPFYRQLQ